MVFFFIPRHRIVHLHARVVLLKLQSGHCDQQSCNKRAYNKNRRAINDYMERLHPMMKYGNFIEVYNTKVCCVTFQVYPRLHSNWLW